MLERNRLLKNAPHYVFALPSILPLRSRFGGIWTSIKRFFGLQAVMNDRGSLITRLGLVIYDVFSRRISALPGFRMLSRARLDQRVPGFADDIKSAALYYEGRITHAERLGLELILDGETMNARSRALNHVEVLDGENGIIRYRHAGQIHAVKPRIIVNAGGAWIDRVNHTLGLDSDLMGGSKGAHLVVDNRALYRALDGHMVYFGTRDGRVNLVYPFVNERVLIGSTDIPIEDPDTADCDAGETAYLKHVVTEIFPDVSVADEQILYRFSGVRPLPRAGGEIGMVTRDHSLVTKIWHGDVAVLCLIGGKWTTFRQFSAEVADDILERLGRQRQISTEDMAIGGGKDFPDAAARPQWIRDRAQTSGLPESRVATLLSRYGTRCERMFSALGRNETPLQTLPDYTREEIGYVQANERTANIDDLLRRRTPVAISGQLTREVEHEVQTIMSLSAFHASAADPA